MTNPNALWEDMAQLNELYEELGWGHNDRLTFKIVKPEVGCPYIAIENLSHCMKEWYG